VSDHQSGNTRSMLTAKSGLNVPPPPSPAFLPPGTLSASHTPASASTSPMLRPNPDSETPPKTQEQAGGSSQHRPSPRIREQESQEDVPTTNNGPAQPTNVSTLATSTASPTPAPNPAPPAPSPTPPAPSPAPPTSAPAPSPTPPTQPTQRKSKKRPQDPGVPLSLLSNVDRNTKDLTALRSEMSEVRTELAMIRELLGKLVAASPTGSEMEE
jgi:hypothetical protein